MRVPFIWQTFDSCVLFLIISKCMSDAFSAQLKFSHFLFSRTPEPISTKVDTKHPRVRGFQFCLTLFENQRVRPFLRGDNRKIAKLIYQRPLGLFHQFFQMDSQPENTLTIFKNLLQNPWADLTKFGTKYHFRRDSSLFKWRTMTVS